MLTILYALVPILLSMGSAAPAPATRATASSNNCWCQSIPLKDWGK
jgi:hypothetical protein